MSAFRRTFFVRKMKKIIGFFKGNAVLTISLAAAVISAFIVPPNKDYIGYVDVPVIILLFCLMAAVAGLRGIGVFDALSRKLLSKTCSTRMIAFILMNLCFFVSMLVTNDVALITFVPLTIGLYAGSTMSSQLIMTIVIETAAANLGSMMTPIGNPQNLFLFRHFEMNGSEFISAVLPLGIVSYAMLCIAVLLVKKDDLPSPDDASSIRAGWRLWVYAAVFVICVLSVADIISAYICLAITVIAMLAADVRLFSKIDYPLLLTFVCFFVFVGNLGNIPAVEQFITQLLAGRELLVSAALSQVISNVPAAAMLADFTDNATELLRGVNIGGLGTPVASLASLISYRFYCAAKDARKGRYMLVFLAVNFAMLTVLMLFGIIL